MQRPDVVRPVPLFLPRHAQTRYLALFVACWLGIFFCTRSLLWLTHLQEAAAGPLAAAQLFLLGTAYDLAFLAYAVLPLAQSAVSTGRRVAVAAGVGLLVGLALYAFAPYVAPLAALGVAVALLISRAQPRA